MFGGERAGVLLLLLLPLTILVVRRKVLFNKGDSLDCCMVVVVTGAVGQAARLR